jgi:hypothetical protein
MRLKAPNAGIAVVLFALALVSGTLDIDASGASRLYFGGSPVMGRVDLSGASSIKRR